MTVYVDKCTHKWRGRLWCHMMTDQGDLAELHEIADEIGLHREWFQEHPVHPHYDLTTQKRQDAIGKGAVAVDGMELVKRCSLILKGSIPVTSTPAPAAEGVDGAGGLISQEEIGQKIARYEQAFGMSSREFLQTMKEGIAPDTFETMDWMILLRYSSDPAHAALTKPAPAEDVKGNG